MSYHPSITDLEALLRGALPDERMPAVLRHLLGGCRSCRAIVYPRAALLLAPNPPKVSERFYDHALDEAFVKVRHLLKADVAVGAGRGQPPLIRSDR